MTQHVCGLIRQRQRSLLNRGNGVGANVNAIQDQLPLTCCQYPPCEVQNSSGKEESLQVLFSCTPRREELQADVGL